MMTTHDSPVDMDGLRADLGMVKDDNSIDHMSTFCHLVIEEFLMNKKMTKTLNAFREEWSSRPSEAASSISWIDIALKLHLPDMIHEDKHKPVIEHIAGALITDASIRRRTPADVIVNGLAEKPRERSVPLPPVETASPSTEEDSNQERVRTSTETDTQTLLKLKSKGGHIGKYSLSTARDTSSVERSKYRPSMSLTKQGKPSSENWIPEQIRFRSIHRDIANLKENLRCTVTLEMEQQRELRRFQTTDLQKAHLEESLNMKRKTQCACCLQPYSHVNLTMKIPVKAIIDIRKKWSGGKGGWWDKDDERLAKVPRCYEGVDICRFCSQFFGSQDEYRPSFDAISYEQRKAQFFETKRQEREYWDPLKMCEKDREHSEDVGLPPAILTPLEGAALTKGLTTVHYE
mmetsp:Transcript_8142/g.12157  ORF Transcript_8142/g.12157 Transcript_8142/m.12157 type:complete len:404 (+) Transcript_8142:3-1214(+)